MVKYQLLVVLKEGVPQPSTLIVQREGILQTRLIIIPLSSQSHLIV